MLPRDFLLQLHRLLKSRLFHLVGYLIRHLSGTRTLLLRVHKDSQSFKARPVDKIEKRPKMFICLTRKTDDKGRSQAHSWNTFPDRGDEILNVFARCFSPHQTKHVLMNMLERHINISGYFPIGRDCSDQFRTPMRGVRVEQPDPEVSRYSL